MDMVCQVHLVTDTVGNRVICHENHNGAIYELT